MDYFIIIRQVKVAENRKMKKKEGFSGQKSIILPENVLADIKKNGLMNGIYLTDIGYYPNAKYHFRERKEGCSQHILIYCTEGAGWFSLGSEKYSVTENSFFILPANMPHSYGADEKLPWTIYWVHFTGTLSRIFSNNETNKIIYEEQSKFIIEERIKLFEEIFGILEMGYSRDNILYSNICLARFLASFRFKTQFNKSLSSLHDGLVEHSILYMRNHLNKKLKLADMAAYAGFSESHFIMLFRKSTHKSPVEYYLELKMQKACNYLDQTELMIKDIALMLGYEDQYYFSRLFCKIMGIPPTEYRKRLKG